MFFNRQSVFSWVPTVLFRLSEYVHRIYPTDFEEKDRTDIVRSASYLDLILEINDDSG